MNVGESGEWTPLILAAYHGYTTTAQALLAAGADMNAVN